MAGTVQKIEDSNILVNLKEDARKVALELAEKAGLKKGQVVVVGCSTSETLGELIGTFSAPEAGEAIYEGLQSVLEEKGIYLVAQCCEHLNRALILEEEAATAIGKQGEIVNVVPQPKAGGSFATACYHRMKKPVALEEIQADAGIDIGGTLIGMHLKRVAVPLRFEQKTIGKALVTGARVRPKFIGGSRAIYDEQLM